MKVCQYCDAHNYDEALYCSKCGANLPPAEQKPSQIPQQPLHIVNNYYQQAPPTYQPYPQQPYPQQPQQVNVIINTGTTEQRKPEEKHGCLYYCWWTFLWMCFFPILPFYFWYKKKTKGWMIVSIIIGILTLYSLTQGGLS
ncbi:MAG: hypothetical protein GX587_11950 [Bacteroidales bacterium]|jgi:hypothetical protein|nr:hypothetical protein [Bacteroidales bacterium]